MAQWQGHLEVTMWHISVKALANVTLCVSMKKICQLMKMLSLKNKTLTQIVKEQC